MSSWVIPLTSDNKGEGLDGFEDDDWNKSDDISRGCIGWEDDMVKNGECF